MAGQLPFRVGDDASKDVAKSYLADVWSQLGRLGDDGANLMALAKAMFEGGLTDDRKYLLENLIEGVASFPEGSPSASIVTDLLLKQLWDNLKHPPLSYMGDEYRYRTADGSNNNVLYPHLGKAGSYYARSVVPQHIPSVVLPDPGAVFDALFARRGSAKPHPAGFSSFAIAVATIIIHDCFRTDDRDSNKVMSSSYLDLAPLYGHDEHQQSLIRTYQDGKIKPDAFSEPRLLGQPPGVCALLICFNRFHNYVVGQLATINENGRFSLSDAKLQDEYKKVVAPDTAEGDQHKKAVQKRDNDLFQTGRLITCGLYINLILNDYVRVILNLNRSNTTWNLDPRTDNFDPFDLEGTPKGIGNQVSIEFNLIYRWHSTTSDRNAKWMLDFFKKLNPEVDPLSVTDKEFIEGFKKWAHSIDTEHPEKWTFGDLKRGPSGSFADADLVDLITKETEDRAGAFGARNVPAIMKAIDVLGMEQGRTWGTASLNEVRQFFKLKPHKTFQHINSDPDVAASLEALYGHPDNVELYPGLIAEEAKPLITNGSGLCAGYTVSKAILSDAVALTRGDRFYAEDSSPANLTAFGFTEIASDKHIANGCVAYKLLNRAFPGWYKPNSVYTLFPLTVPGENMRILQSLGKLKDDDYSDEPPKPPTLPTPITTWKAATSIMMDQVKYKVPWGPAVFDMTHHDWMLSGDKAFNKQQKAFCLHALYDPVNGMQQIIDAYTQITRRLIQQHKKKLRDCYQIDAVRHVGNLSHAEFAARLFHIPIEGRGGDMTAAQLHEAFVIIFAYTFLNIDPAKSFNLRQQGKKVMADLEKVITASCEGVEQTLSRWLQKATGKGMHEDVLVDYGAALVHKFFEAGMSIDEVVGTIIPTAAAAGPQLVQGLVRMLDFYLLDSNKAHWEAIKSLAQQDTPASLEKLRKYALEAWRLNPPVFGVLRTVDADAHTVSDGPRQVPLHRGQLISLDFEAAGRDAAAFPDPLAVNPDRPDESYVVQGFGPHQCLGRRIAQVGMAVQLREFARLNRLRRAPGPAGQLQSTKVMGSFLVYLKADRSDWSPFPESWALQFDE